MRRDRAGELTLIVVPDAAHEALRDLVRARRGAQRDVIRARHQLTQMLLRHGHRYRETRHWRQQHWAWIRAIELPQEDAQNVLLETRLMIEQRVDQLAGYDSLIEQASSRPHYAPYVAALRTLRGIDTLTAMSMLGELGDLRRFATAPQMMAAVGLVPSEYSTGDHNHWFAITKTGNGHIRYLAVESAWHYQRHATAGTTLLQRRGGQPASIVDIARRCDLRLHRKFVRLTSRGKPSTVAVVAVARELVGFIWAIGQQFALTWESETSS